MNKREGEEEKVKKMDNRKLIISGIILAFLASIFVPFSPLLASTQDGSPEVVDGDEIIEHTSYAEVMVVFQPNASCVSDSAFQLIQEKGGIIVTGIDKEINAIKSLVLEGEEQFFTDEINKNETIKYTETGDYITYPSLEMTTSNEVEYIVCFWSDVSCSSDLVLNLIQKNGGEVKEADETLNFVTVGVPRGEEQNFVRNISKNETVKFVELNYGKFALYGGYVPTDPQYSRQWNLPQIHCPGAWDITKGYRDVIVAVVDTGVDYDHPDLDNNMWRDAAGHYGYDFADDDNNPMDCDGHGTHCAGIAAAEMDNGEGGCGVAPNVRIMAVKIFRQKPLCPCAVAAVKGNVDNPEEKLNLLRELRDKFIKDEYVELYYDYSPEIMGVLLREPLILGDTAKLIVKYEPAARYVVGKGGEDLEINEEDVKEAISLIERIEAEVEERKTEIGTNRSSNIIKSLEEFKAQINASEGKTFSQAFQGSIYFESNPEEKLNTAMELSEKLNLLVKLMDNFIKDRYVNLFYEYSPEMRIILLEEPYLLVDAYELVAKYEPAVRYVMSEEGGEDLQITGGDVKEAISLIERLEEEIKKREGEIGAERSSDMIRLLEEFKEQVNASEGKTFSQALQDSIYFEEKGSWITQSPSVETKPEWIAKGIIYAADQGADVISMSFGGYTRYSIVAEAVRYAYNKDCILVAAAANDNRRGAAYPAKFDEVIAISSIGRSDARSSFSNYGPEIELCAPGERIYSTWWDNTYADKSGTSMSAPHVAGVAALVRSLHSDWSNEEVRTRLTQTADDLGASGRDEYYGYGKVNASAAVGGWSFVIITDLHIGRGYPDYGAVGLNDGETGQEYYLTERLRNAVQWINDNYQSYNIEFVVVLGDISDSGEYSELKKAKDILDDLDKDIPYIPVIGNHDIWPYTDKEEYQHLRYFEPVFRDVFENLTNNPDLNFEWQPDRGELVNYKFTYNGMNFVILDCNTRDAALIEHGTYLGAKLFPKTLEWLTQCLNEHKGESIILISHHPMT